MRRDDAILGDSDPDAPEREDTLSVRQIREHGFDLGLQRRGVEGLDDVVIHTGLLGGDESSTTRTDIDKSTAIFNPLRNRNKLKGPAAT